MYFIHNMGQRYRTAFRIILKEILISKIYYLYHKNTHNPHLEKNIQYDSLYFVFFFVNTDKLCHFLNQVIVIFVQFYSSIVLKSFNLVIFRHFAFHRRYYGI